MLAHLLFCTCAPLTAQGALERADVVFEGKVLETSPDEAPAREACPAPAEGAAPPASFKGGCLDGFVRSARTCSPLAGAAVTAKLEGGATANGVADTQGHYQICDLTPGAYRVEASFDFARHEQSANVVEGQVSLLHFRVEMSPMEKGRFAVSRAFKGLEGEREITVRANRNITACGYQLEVGQSYLVYAQRLRGNLYTGLCSGTKRVEDAKVDLGILRAPRKGGCAGCATGGGGAWIVPAVLMACGLLGASGFGRPNSRGSRPRVRQGGRTIR
jgi:hypothetical protein